MKPVEAVEAIAAEARAKIMAWLPESTVVDMVILLSTMPEELRVKIFRPKRTKPAKPHKSRKKSR